MAEFVNPYNFLPLDDKPGKASPPGHDRYQAELFSGKFDVTITAMTPLLLLEQAAEGYVVFRDPQGNPLLTGSALKGAIRAGFEALSNSRFGVFGSWDRPLAYREKVQDANGKLPAVVLDQGGTGVLHVVKKLKPKNVSGTFLPAVFVPFNLIGQLADKAEVEAWICPIEHRSGRFRGWRAVAVSEPQKLGTAPTPQPRGSFTPISGQECVKVSGYLLKTGNTFNSKHDDRLVVTAVHSPNDVDFDATQIAINDEIKGMWTSVIEAYRAAERDKLPTPNGCPRGPYAMDSEAENWELVTGRTLHVVLEQGTNEVKIIGLSPAMIGRKPYPTSPVSRARNYQPAKSCEDLSDADVVFGWVGDDDAWRGLIRIDPPKCTKAEVKEFTKPVQLAALESPKPQNWRFYSGDAYESKPIRGRKVYLHQKTYPDNHWTPDGTGEWEHNGDKIPESSIKVKQWLDPGTIFTTVLRFENLTKDQFSWLYRTLQQFPIKLGRGKPLGFGVTQVEVKCVEIFTGDALKNRYLTGDCKYVDEVDADTLTVLREGVANPVHYPRLDEGSGQGYEWFGPRQYGSTELPQIADVDSSRLSTALKPQPQNRTQQRPNGPRPGKGRKPSGRRQRNPPRR